MGKNTRTRRQIIDECIAATTACFNYYSNSRLSNEACNEVAKALDKTLPDQINVSSWKRYADEHDEMIRLENEENES